MLPVPPPATTTIRRVPRYVVGLFFGVLLALGGALVADYGISWDEPNDRLNGLVNLRYVADQLAPGWANQHPALREQPPLAGYHDNDHGVLFELPLAWLDVLRPGPDDPRAYYLLRHAAMFLLSLGGVWALFRLGTWRFRDERLGLLAAGLLVLSPRFFAESFYNAKDLVFTAGFTLGAYALVRLLARPSGRRALLHGLVTAATIDIRVLGLLLVPFTLGLLALQALRAAPAAGYRSRLLRAGLLYCAVVAAGTVAGWPYLWASPLANFSNAFDSLSHFAWNGLLLYNGELMPATDVPWHYAPVWISLTTPVAYQLAALLGLAATVAQLLRQPWARARTAEGQVDLLLLGWLLLPLGLVIGFHSALYDGWRHLYFIYPALLLLAVRGGLAVGALGRRGPRWHRLALGLGLLAGAEGLLTAGRMVRMHPHQQTYFSYLPGPLAERLYERDYWGLAARQGLEYLVRRQPTGLIYYDVPYAAPVRNNLLWLSAADQARLVRQPSAPGRYYLSTYRATPAPYADSVGREVFALRPDGVKILAIFQRLPADSAGARPPAW